MAAVRSLFNKANSQSRVGEGVVGGVKTSKVTGILCERREPQSASIYSLGLSPFMSLNHP